MADRTSVAATLSETAAADRGLRREEQPASQQAEAGGLFGIIGNRAASERIGAQRGLLVDDDAKAAPEQIHKTEFLDRMRTEIAAATDTGLSGTGETSSACPYLDHWIGVAAGWAASKVERGIRLFAPESANASSVTELVAAVKNRTRGGAGQWPMTGAAGDIGGAIPGLLFKARPGGARGGADPGELQRSLGPGQPLDSEVRKQLEPALGADLALARVHLDSNAAALSDGMNARAFTVGEHVAFGAGEYRPGTPAGDALIAHEMAHVVQQSMAQQNPVQRSSRGSASTLELEADADWVAEGAVRRNWLGETAQAAMPRMRSGLALARCSKSDPRPAVDQHAGLTVPDATRLTSLQKELHPTSAAAGPGVAPLPWDGAAVAGAISAAAATARAALKAELTQKILDSLNKNLTDLAGTITANRAPIESLEGPGRAAKRLVDARYASWIDVAAEPPGTPRHGFQFRAKPPAAVGGPPQTLFDANDTTQRAASGHPIDPTDLANWISATDSGADTVKKAHHFDPTDSSRGPDESLFLEAEIIAPFVSDATNKAKLKKFDLFGFAESSPTAIVTPTTLAPGAPASPAGGPPNLAERSLRWQTWELVTHEYIHTLEHAVFSSATHGNRVMTEGFCEMFTKEVLLEWIPKAPSDATLRKEVEGATFGPPPTGMIPPYNSGDYAQYVTHAENIRDTVIGGAAGENAVRAAYLQGHIEYIGLKPGGAQITPGASSDLIAVPAGITTIDALAAAANLPKAIIASANPGVPAAGPLPASVRLPGAREHRVVVAGVVAETKGQIANQNGVTEGELEKANPGLNWASLTAGKAILIPKH